jgi:RimJ/RimL family protein N-acetyltransferase
MHSDPVFLDCEFVRCEWYCGLFNCAVFVGITFFDCKFRGTSLASCKFVECEFHRCEFTLDNLGGSCNFFDSQCVVGYEISLLHQSRGFMNETPSAVLAWGFKEMELNRVEAHVHPDNRASP